MKPGQFDPTSIEQRWDELDTLLLGSKPGGTRLDGETASCVRRLLLAVLEEAQLTIWEYCAGGGKTAEVSSEPLRAKIEALETVETPDPDVQLSLLEEKRA